MFAQILMEIRKLDKTFTYIIPNHMKVEVGMRCIVPFGGQQLEGFVIEINETFQGDYDLKEIAEVIDTKPVLNSEMLKLGKYMSKKYLCSLISAYQTMLPRSLKAKYGTKRTLKKVSYLILVEDFIPKTENQKKIKELFRKQEILKKTANAISVSTVKKLIETGYLKEIVKEEYRLTSELVTKTKAPTLTTEQQQVIEEITLNKFNPYLLFGVTGSGKTEVYMQLIAKVLQKKKQALVLVPEISLTPQLVNTFKTRFDRIAILHSGLSNEEKYDEWRKIDSKEIDIVIGARSAVFAPLENIGIIIIDEEHSSTYKQENNPRYNAIDIAITRAKNFNCPIILGSATPSIESFTRAKMGVYQLLEIKKRINNQLPSIELIDMKNELKKGNNIFSNTLRDKINDRLLKDEQIILLLNRRGYNTIITCQNCGYVHKCPNCDIPLTYHKKHNRMQCHYCNYMINKLTTCPTCQTNKFNEFGIGTEKLQEEINNNFPLAKVIRMDIDTTRTKKAHENILKAFRNQEYNILIGTQMIAKGLDFPKVSLVGVINGDASLNIPDFRSGERTFQLLSQVAGRSGRSDIKGEVIIQGFNIDHYSLVKASKHDYLGFYNLEIKIRKQLNYPPFYNLALIKIQSKDEDILIKEADKISCYLRENLKNEIILGPTVGAVPKVDNTYYMNIIIKYKKTEEVIEVFEFLLKKYSNNKINVSIDFNPYRF